MAISTHICKSGERVWGSKKSCDKCFPERELIEALKDQADMLARYKEKETP